MRAALSALSTSHPFHCLVLSSQATSDVDRTLFVPIWHAALGMLLTCHRFACLPLSFQATSDVDRAVRVEFWRAGSRSMKPVARAIKNGNVLKQRLIELFVSLHDLKVGAGGGRRRCQW